MTFSQLLVQRWLEACRAVGLQPDVIPITWDIGEYDHFKSKRGYAVAVSNGDGTYHIRFAPKILKAPVHRADGLIRHEIGHIVDFLVDKPQLNAWADHRGFALPSTPERRADAIAECIWLEPVLYDQDTVQSTRVGISPRPSHLGL